MNRVGLQLVVVHPFTAEGEGELTVPQGAVLTLLEPENEANAGWVLARTQDERSGYVPVDFLRVASAESAKPAESTFRDKATSRMSVALPPALVAQQQQEFGVPPAISGFPPAPFTSQGSMYSSFPQQPAYGVAPPTAQLHDPWAQRDTLYGLHIRTPIPPQRRWFYRDLFGDKQGPFNAQEMRQRVEAKHIQAETFCLIEVGSGAAQCFEERKLKELFPSMESAFLQAPSLGGKRAFWYYQDDAKIEHGPFSADQMRLWFDVEGYFGSKTMVREAVYNSTFTSLQRIYPDPMTCFLDAMPPAQRSASFKAPTPVQIIDPFNSSVISPPRSPAQSSSRHLLQAALSGGTTPPPPPPAIGSQPQATLRQQYSQDLDETLALFDQVGLETEEEQKKSAASKPKPVMRIYGNPDIWPAWKGVPNVSGGKSNAFPTILYHFFTRPLNPNAGKILCHITREIDGLGHFNYNKFVLYLENENGPQPTAVAYRLYNPVSTTFEIKLFTTGREDTKTALTIAKMEVNFMGTQFLLHNSVSGHQGKAKDLCCILYESNRMGKGGPRKMKVGIPDVDENKCEFKHFTHGASGSDSMVTALQSLNAKNLIPMLNKPPRWNPERNAYSLDFGGRVTRASVKNFQLVDALSDSEHQNVILQHGRVGQDKFTMDVQHPMSLLQAFAVCLSSLHQKKAVD